MARLLAHRPSAEQVHSGCGCHFGRLGHLEQPDLADADRHTANTADLNPWADDLPERILRPLRLDDGRSAAGLDPVSGTLFLYQPLVCRRAYVGRHQGLKEQSMKIKSIQAFPLAYPEP